MISERVNRRLQDLCRIAQEAAYIAGHGEEVYLEDSMHGTLLRNAGERILIKVATVVEKLPSEFKSRFPEVDWIGIQRMRNLVAHHYDKVNDDLLWQALTVRVPSLVQTVTGDATSGQP